MVFAIHLATYRGGSLLAHGLMNLWNGTYPEQIPGQRVALYDPDTLNGNLKSDQEELDLTEIIRITAVTPDAADCYRFGFEGGLYLNRHIQRKDKRQ